MDTDDKVLNNGFYVHSLSSSEQSTQEKNEHLDDVSRDQELLQEYLKYVPKKELLRTCFDKENNPSTLTKCKLAEQFLKTSNKGSRNQEPKRTSNQTSNQQPKKQSRKGENPIRLPSAAGLSQEGGSSNTRICTNSACRAIISSDDIFCKRCSCCICHLFDDNKDPSLWLVCTSESDKRDSCGLSCHIECAIQRKKVGVVNLGQLMQLDGGYCCAACGKVSGILGSWKKQLIIAKDARRVDVLCHRISLCYRLLDGTSRFKELHEIVSDAKAKLEIEVGPVSGDSAKMARGIVGRLSIAADMQNLCTLAIEKADAWINSISNVNMNYRENSLPDTCRFLFEEVTSSSLVIVLNDLCASSHGTIRGFKLWYCPSKEDKEQSFSTEPTLIISTSQTRILISNLQPSTEYLFQIISFTDYGNLGRSEAKCFTKSIEIVDSEITTIDDEKFDLNVASMPDLNAELIPLRDEDDECTLERVVEADEKSSRSSDTQTYKTRRGREVESRKQKPSCKTEAHDCISTLINGSHQMGGSDHLDGNYEYCVKIIRWLECGGHIKQEFRMKFLTWFSLRSTEQERRVVNTFIQTLIDDPSCLAGQLVDSFSDIVTCKRARYGLCTKLWH